MKILIVEDEPSLREVMKRTLVREGYVVETAGTFAEADDKLAAYAYDCILLDIMLPDGNGLNLLERIKSEGKRENVIIISARGAMEDKVAGLELVADDYRPKPFHMMELSARIRSVASAGVDPRYMGLGPVPATRKALDMAGLTLDDIQLIELNEAFAAQSLGCIRELGLENRTDIINVNGGAIALGHPIGSSGSRILVTLVHELNKRGLRYGLATLCIAGGMGMATIVETIDE